MPVSRPDVPFPARITAGSSCRLGSACMKMHRRFTAGSDPPPGEHHSRGVRDGGLRPHDGDGDGGRGHVNVLAIETATDACSCALECSGAIVVRHVVEPRRHTELLLPMIDAVLAEAGIGLRALDAIAFGRGPGSFTGLRIACAVAAGLVHGAEDRVRGCAGARIRGGSAAGSGLDPADHRRRRAPDAGRAPGCSPHSTPGWAKSIGGGFEWDGMTMAPVFDESGRSAGCGPRPGGGTDGPGPAPGWPAYRAVLDARLGDRLGTVAGVPAARGA